MDAVTLDVLTLSTALWTIYGGVMPLASGRPWISSSRLEAGAILAVLVLAFAVDAVRAWSAWNAGAAGPDWGIILATFLGGVIGTLFLARRGHSVRGVGEEAFRGALATALAAGGYAYGLQVGGDGRLTAIDLEGRWAGIELSVRWRSGTGTLRAHDASGAVVVEDLVEGMRGSFEAEHVEPNRVSSVLEVVAGIGLAAVYVAVR